MMELQEALVSSKPLLVPLMHRWFPQRFPNRCRHVAPFFSRCFVVFRLPLLDYSLILVGFWGVPFPYRIVLYILPDSLRTRCRVGKAEASVPQIMKELQAGLNIEVRLDCGYHPDFDIS